MPKKLPTSVLAALGLASQGTDCADTIVGPCLSPVVHPKGTDVGPCLEIAPEPDTEAPAPEPVPAAVPAPVNVPPPIHVGPCLRIMPEPPVEPCLSPIPDPLPPPEIGPCLDMVMPEDAQLQDLEPKDAPPAAPERSAAVDKVLDAGVLPEDVAKTLRARRRK